jgi:hypothetical protein
MQSSQSPITAAHSAMISHHKSAYVRLSTRFRIVFRKKNRCCARRWTQQHCLCAFQGLEGQPPKALMSFIDTKNRRSTRAALFPESLHGRPIGQFRNAALFSVALGEPAYHAGALPQLDVRMRNCRHAGSPDSEHRGEDFLRERKRVVTGQIPRAKQPSA